jgi:hypothetical protein
MSKIVFLLTLPVIVFVGVLPAAPAQAAAARTFLSAAGSDSNNCSNVVTPCRHLAAAYAATAANGEIYVLDPANYGSVTITGPVSIEGHGWASIAPPSGGNAITINANTGDKINIIGVVLDGTALTGTNGIQFNSGGNLTVRDSVIRNFGANGISFQPNISSQLLVSNTLVSDNGFGVLVAPTTSVNVTGVLDHVTIENNANDGLYVGSSPASVTMAVSDSVSAGNGARGIVASQDSPTNLMVRNCTIANNSTDGLFTSGVGAQILVTRSTIIGNGTGWFAQNSGVVLSYADNNIDGNGAANTEPPNPLTYK